MAENGARGTATEQGFRAWQEGMSAFMRTLTPGLQGGGTQVEEGVNRIITRLSDVTNAQVAVAAGWLQLPFAVASGNPGGLQNLQAGYGRLVQAYNALFLAYLGAGTPSREAALASVQRATSATAEAARTGAAATRGVIEQPGAQADTATRGLANGATQLAGSAVDQAIRVAEAAQQNASPSPSGPLGSGPIKGKIGRDGGRIYHLPGQANYDRFVADMLFATEEEARAAGFRPSQR